MLTKNDIKFIKSINKKRERDVLGLFVAEGSKLVIDLIRSGGKLERLLATSAWMDEQFSFISNNQLSPIEISNSEMERITGLSSASPVLAIFHQPLIDAEIPEDGSAILILDDIRDPGNMGTIIRTADWFGIKHLVCSMETVDCFNQKVIQSTMGSIIRVKIRYTELPEFINNNKNRFTFYGTFMNGNSIIETQYNKPTALIIGNEAHGISSEVEKLVDQRITIPGSQINDGIAGPESLNAAVATSVVLFDWFGKK
jgi:RNA methyltransferase, TrmH family